MADLNSLLNRIDLEFRNAQTRSDIGTHHRLPV